MCLKKQLRGEEKAATERESGLGRAPSQGAERESAGEGNSYFSEAAGGGGGGGVQANKKVASFWSRLTSHLSRTKSSSTNPPADSTCLHQATSTENCPAVDTAYENASAELEGAGNRTKEFVPRKPRSKLTASTERKRPRSSDYTRFSTNESRTTQPEPATAKAVEAKGSAAKAKAKAERQPRVAAEGRRTSSRHSHRHNPPPLELPPPTRIVEAAPTPAPKSLLPTTPTVSLQPLNTAAGPVSGAIFTFSSGLTTLAKPMAEVDAPASKAKPTEADAVTPTTSKAKPAEADAATPAISNPIQPAPSPSNLHQPPPPEGS